MCERVSFEAKTKTGLKKKEKTRSGARAPTLFRVHKSCDRRARILRTENSFLRASVIYHFDFARNGIDSQLGVWGDFMLENLRAGTSLLRIESTWARMDGNV